MSDIVHANSIDEAIHAVYTSLAPTQLAIYHRVDIKTATRLHAEIAAGKQPSIYESEKYMFCFAKGGFRSGKTFSDVFRNMVKSMMYSGHDAIVIRKHHEQLRNSYLMDFKLFVEKITSGHMDWIILDEKPMDGAIELFIRSVGKPSRIIFKIEPEAADEMKIRNAFKGYSTIADFTAEEANELKKTTVNLMVTRLSRTDVPLGGTILTNPDYERAWTTLDFSRYTQELSNGERPQFVPILCKTRDIEKHLPPTYIATLEEQYKDDPVGLAMALEGTDGITQTGRPVFRGFYFPNLHEDPTVRFNPDLPLWRGWDFGFRVGACGFWQVDKLGRAYKIAELLSENTTAENFAKDVASYSSSHFPLAMNIIDCGDPAGLQEKDTGSSIRVINRALGIHIRTMHHGEIENGLDHMRLLLADMREGKPRLRYHPRCSVTIQAMRFGYHYKVQRDNRVQNTPHKDGWFEHPMDEDRYTICHMIPVTKRAEKDGDQISTAIRAKGMADIRRARAEETFNDWLRRPPQGKN